MGDEDLVEALDIAIGEGDLEMPAKWLAIVCDDLDGLDGVRELERDALRGKAALEAARLPGGSAFMSRTWSMMPTSVTSTPRLRHASTVLSETMEVPLTSMRLHPGLVMASFRRSASSMVLSMMGSYPQSRGKPTGVGTEPTQ